MGSISSKINTIGYNKDNDSVGAKFMGSLLSEISSTENIEKITTYLKAKGIEIKPSNWKVFSVPFEIIQKRYEEMAALGEEEIYKNPDNLCKNTLIDRVRYFKDNNIPLKEEKGKYKIELLNIIDFQKKYPDAIKKDDEIKINPVNSEEEVIENPLSLGKRLRQKYFSDSDTEEKLTQVQSERYLRLEPILDKIIEDVLGSQTPKEKARTYLKSLIVSDTPQDKLVLYYSIIHGLNLTDDVLNKIKESIDYELQVLQVSNEISGGRTS